MGWDAVMAGERLSILNFRCFVEEFGLYPKDLPECVLWDDDRKERGFVWSEPFKRHQLGQ